VFDLPRFSNGPCGGGAVCLWIDDDHLLIEDAVFSIVTGDVIALTAKGVCAGRYPGGL